jgi:hypothetical protein
MGGLWVVQGGARLLLSTAVLPGLGSGAELRASRGRGPWSGGAAAAAGPDLGPFGPDLGRLSSGATLRGLVRWGRCWCCKWCVDGLPAASSARAGRGFSAEAVSWRTPLVLEVVLVYSVASLPAPGCGSLAGSKLGLAGMEL